MKLLYSLVLLTLLFSCQENLEKSTDSVEGLPEQQSIDSDTINTDTLNPSSRKEKPKVEELDELDDTPEKTWKVKDDYCSKCGDFRSLMDPLEAENCHIHDTENESMYDGEKARERINNFLEGKPLIKDGTKMLQDSL